MRCQPWIFALNSPLFTLQTGTHPRCFTVKVDRGFIPTAYLQTVTVPESHKNVIANNRVYSYSLVHSSFIKEF